MLLTKDYTKFKTDIADFITKGKKNNEQNLKTEEELNQFNAEKKEWINSCFDYLKESFTGEENGYFANAFLETKNYNLGLTLPVHQRVKITKDDLTERVNNLPFYLKLLDISDAIINPKLVEIENRKKYAVQDKKNCFCKNLKS